LIFPGSFKNAVEKRENQTKECAAQTFLPKSLSYENKMKSSEMVALVVNLFLLLFRGLTY